MTVPLLTFVVNCRRSNEYITLVYKLGIRQQERATKLQAEAATLSTAKPFKALLLGQIQPLTR